MNEIFEIEKINHFNLLSNENYNKHCMSVCALWNFNEMHAMHARVRLCTPNTRAYIRPSPDYCHSYFAHHRVKSLNLMHIFVFIDAS